MITNERQYRITKAQLSRLRKAAESFDIQDAAGRTGSEVLAKAELEALRSEMRVLSGQTKEYEALKSGAMPVLKTQNLNDLPTTLIRARIARGLSQRELAEALGVKEQQVQRYESERYASASLSKLTRIACVLGLTGDGVAESGRTYSIMKRGTGDIRRQLSPAKQKHRRKKPTKSK